MDPAVIGSCRIGYTRIGVYQPVFDTVLQRLETTHGSFSGNVTRRTLSLGTRDSETGWRAVTHTDDTIKAITVPRGATYRMGPVGFYAHEDLLALTAAPVNIYDQLQPSNQAYYTVVARQQHTQLDNHVCYELHAQETPLWQATAGSTTWTLTRPRDPRYRIKNWLDTNLTASQITKDNDSSTATYAVLFDTPPYPLALEFRASSAPVHGVYAVGMPVETSLMDAVAQAPYAYAAVVPITVTAVDSTGCSGTSLWWKMVAELRNVAETHSTGSLLSPDPLRPTPEQVGGMTLWQSTFHLNYRRLAST